MPEKIVLNTEDISLLLEAARGLTNYQIAVRRGVNVGNVHTLLGRLYKKLGVFDLGQMSRGYALAVAVTRHGLAAPDELKASIAIIGSDRFAFEDELDPIILKLIAEGYTVREIAYELDETRETISTRMAEMRLRTQLALYPPFCVAAAAIWANKLTELDLNRSYVPNRDDLDLLLDIILERSLSEIAARLRVSPVTAKARIRALRFRMGLRTQNELIDTCVRAGWLRIPNDERIILAVDLVQREGLSARELKAVRLLATGLSRTSIASQMTQDLPDISLDWLFHRLYTHVGVSDSAPLIAIVYWAGEPLAEVQEPDNGQLTDEEIKFLVCLAKGLDGEGVAHVMGLAKSTSDNRLGNLYRKMGATNAVHAVALAARDGLLDTWFGTIEIEAAQANQFSGLFIRYLAIRANGTDKVRAAGPLGISSGRTLERRIKGDRDRMSLPLITTIAILVRKGEISVNGPSVLPKPAPAAEAAIVEGSTTEAEAAAQPTASSAVPATQPRKTVVARTNELVAGNRYQNIVIKGTASVAKPLAQYIASNFPDVIAGIRATEIDAPWWHDRYVSTGQLSTSVELFLQLLANGQSLEEVRSAFTEIVDTEPQAFRKWYMKFVCGPLGAPGPREAACITLWKGQIE